MQIADVPDVRQSDQKRGEARSPGPRVGRVVGKNRIKGQMATGSGGLQDRKLFLANFRSEFERVLPADQGEVIGEAVGVLDLD